MLNAQRYALYIMIMIMIIIIITQQSPLKILPWHETKMRMQRKKKHLYVVDEYISIVVSFDACCCCLGCVSTLLQSIALSVYHFYDVIYSLANNSGRIMCAGFWTLNHILLSTYINRILAATAASLIWYSAYRAKTVEQITMNRLQCKFVLNSLFHSLCHSIFFKIKSFQLTTMAGKIKLAHFLKIILVFEEK